MKTHCKSSKICSPYFAFELKVMERGEQEWDVSDKLQLAKAIQTISCWIQ